MFKSLKRGWAITAASWTVLKRHPKLIVLPALSAAALVALLALLALAAGATNLHSLSRLAADAEHGRAAVYALFFAGYFVCFFAGIFFNAALVFCALQAFAGQEPSLMKGIATAFGRLPQIFMWALVASTVGLLLQALKDFLEDKLGLFGSLLDWVGSMAWAALTYFVVPVLVVDGVGPVAAVKRSSAILRQKWGESVGGEGGLGLIYFVLTLPGVLFAVLAGSQGGGAMVPALLIAGLYILVLALLVMTLSTLFRTGVYIYATTGQTPAAIGEDLIQGTFRKK
jgi:hypothetical protein